ncbi:hypothetical protein E5D57_007883 [Metarhizium anisopliae]|nr:hypothetical protein E5D57_007883 [Metarhizium anisopliae]
MLPNTSTTQPLPPPAYFPGLRPNWLWRRNGLDCTEDNRTDEALSSIRLHINAAVEVLGDSNCVSISESPADRANAIARAILNTIKENSSGQCGIPMVDEDGRPRPIKIKVDASTEVLGADNVVAHEEIIIGESRKRRQFDDELLHRPAKRRRDAGPSSSSS